MEYDLLHYNDVDSTRQDCYYVYVLLDPRKEGSFTYGDYVFPYKPFYVGKGIRNRWRVHTYRCREHENVLRSRIIKKLMSLDCKYYCAKVFYTENETEAYKVEQTLITSMGLLINNTGILTNLDTGLYEARLPPTEEQREKMRLGRLGKKHSKETIEQISRNRKGKMLGENHHWYGTHLSEDQKTNLRLHNITHRYEAIDPNGLLHIFYSFTNFCKQYNLNTSHFFYTLKKGNLYKGWKIISKQTLPDNWEDTKYFEEYLKLTSEENTYTNAA